MVKCFIFARKVGNNWALDRELCINVLHDLTCKGMWKKKKGSVNFDVIEEQTQKYL